MPKPLLNIATFLLLMVTTLTLGAGTDSTSVAVDTTFNEEAYYNHIDSLIGLLNYQTGHYDIGSIAAIDIPSGFKFLSAKDAQTVLASLWGNPPDDAILGLLVPDSIQYFDPSSWAISFSYDEDGHVKDDDAEDINYKDLLEEMKEASVSGNEQRVKEGYQKIQLIGWAQEPFYDKTTHKLHWAKELKFGNDSVNTLNYNIRMLGRKGVLVMNIISGLDNMHVVKSHMNTILASTNFINGNRYEDFDDSMDKIAEYGIGGLVAGGILAKTGFLAKIGIFLVKIWKIIAVGVISIFGWIKTKFFGRKE